MDALKFKLMKPTRFLTAAVTTFALWAGAAHAQAPADFAIKDGDHVVFYGDSITDQRQYTIMAENYIVTRFPKLNVSFTHSGWGGDRVGGGGGGPIDVRLKRDVLAYKPTVVSIMLGMNDGGYRAFDQGLYDTYTKGYQHIIDTLKAGAPGVRITAIQPSPYDDVTQKPKFDGGYNATLLKYSQYLADLAQKEKLGLADFNTPVVAMLQKANADSPDLAVKILPDRVHPSPAGHLVMATALLKSWNAPAVVTSVEIDAAAKKVVRGDNTKVADLKTDGPITWSQADAALPFPINFGDPLIALAVKSSNVVDLIDQEPLKVTGLTAAKYQLKIDDAVVGSYTKEELAAGLNLALLQTPMAQQAARVAGLTQLRSNAHNERWRYYQVPLEKDDSPAIKAISQTVVPALLAAFDAKDADFAKQQHAAAQPVPHTYTLTAQP